jgi:hypothetical protein
MEILVLVHNLLRWILLPIILFILYRSYVGWLTNKAFEKLDNVLGGAMIGLAHSQLLIGLIIYFSSERGLKLLSTPGVMKDAISRLYALEHPLTMIIAIVLLQLGRSFSKKASNDTARFKTIAIYTSIAMLLILSRQINWNLPAF